MNRTKFENWLQNQPRKIAGRIAARAALRVLPIALQDIPKRNERQMAHCFASCRAALTATIAEHVGAQERVSTANTAAARASRTAHTSFSTARAIGAAAHAAEVSAGIGDEADFAIRAINSACRSFERATVTDIGELSNETARQDANDLIFDASRDDISHILNDIWNAPLWKSKAAPDPVELRWKMFGRHSLQATEWSFWREWYQGFLDGKPLDWELQKEIALIPNADWEKGPEWIAGLIEGIQAKFLARKLPQAETIHFNDETARFYAEPQPVAKPDLLGATLEQVSDALDDVLADPSNGLNDTSREARVLRRTVTKYGNNPQRVEMDLTSTHASLTRQIATEELPPSEENIALQRALQEGAQGIRATDPEIEENRRLLTEQALKELTGEQLAVLAEAQPILEAISEGELAEDWGEDIPYLLSDELRVPGAPELGGAERNRYLAGYDEKIRVFGRAGKIMILIRQTPGLIHAIDGSAGYKAAGIIATIGALVMMGITLI